MQEHEAAVVQHRPCVPTGYRFTPTPEEVIRGYLNPWVTTGHTAGLCPGVVCVADIYAADPDALTSRFRDHAHDGSWYFLCVVRWKGGKIRGRMNRCVRGGGTWLGSSKRRAVGREGYRQGFEYRAAGNEKTVWIMEEFVTNLEAATDDEGVKVICKVYHSPRAASAMDAVVEQETKNSKMVAARSSKRPLLMVRGDQYDDTGRSSYIASASHHRGAAADAGVSKRARLLDSEHAAAYPVSIMAPPPAEYYAAGTSQHGAPESASDNWHQSMLEQGMVDQYDVEGSSYIASSPEHQGGLLVDAGGGSKRDRLLDDEHALATAYTVSTMEPPPAEYYAGGTSQQSAPESAAANWLKAMVEQEVAGGSSGDVIDGEEVPSAQTRCPPWITAALLLLQNQVGH